MTTKQPTAETDWHGRWDIHPGESWVRFGAQGLQDIGATAAHLGALCGRLSEEATKHSDELLVAFLHEAQACAFRVEVGARRIAATTEREAGRRDVVDEGSMESFPASDPATHYMGP